MGPMRFDTPLWLLLGYIPPYQQPSGPFRVTSSNAEENDLEKRVDALEQQIQAIIPVGPS